MTTREIHAEPMPYLVEGPVRIHNWWWWAEFLTFACSEEEALDHFFCCEMSALTLHEGPFASAVDARRGRVKPPRRRDSDDLERPAPDLRMTTTRLLDVYESLASL